MALRGLPREKVLATVVHLLETTLIRVGNDDYARENKSYGLTTLRNPHVKVEGAELRFQFKGKSGKTWRLQVKDRRIAKIVRACQDLPGQRLFQYQDEAGEVREVSSADVNAYLKEITGSDITAKDFRTWAGTVMAALALQEFEAFDTQASRKKNLKAAIERVAARLGNTPTICRKCYIHPEVLNAYAEGPLLLQVKEQVEQELREDLARSARGSRGAGDAGVAAEADAGGLAAGEPGGGEGGSRKKRGGAGAGEFAWRAHRAYGVRGRRPRPRSAWVEDLADRPDAGLAEVVAKPSISARCRRCRPGDLEPGVDEGPDQPGPHRALVVGGVARAQVAVVGRLVVGVPGRQRAQAHRREQRSRTASSTGASARGRAPGAAARSRRPGWAGTPGRRRPLAVDHVVQVAACSFQKRGLNDSPAARAAAAPAAAARRLPRAASAPSGAARCTRAR